MKKLVLILLMGWHGTGYAKEPSFLMRAVQDHDMAKTKQLIKQGADVNFHTGDWMVRGKTALMIAAQNGNVPLMRLLIQAGADINAHEGWEQPTTGKPVLRYAIDSGNLEAVNLLLKHGAKPNTFTECPFLPPRRKANIRNLTLLSCAINTHAPIAIIKALIHTRPFFWGWGGADVNKKSAISPVTPLMVAAFKGYSEAVSVLLAAGADTKIQNEEDDNRTALDYAKEAGHQKIVDLLDMPIERKISWWENVLNWFGAK